MFSRVYGADISGVEARLVCVETDISGGLPQFSMVGLLSSEVREARERVMTAFANSGFDLPPRKITINLSPANIRKQGTGFDIPIAVSILAALGEIPEERLRDTLFAGELSLDGTINPVNGILPVALMARQEGFSTLVVPRKNTFEGAVISGIRICGAASLRELVLALKEETLIPVEHIDLEKQLLKACEEEELDFMDIRGQENAKRATEVAVAGFHNLLYVGPPGSGKSMMAKRIPTILNRLTVDECLEISKIYSVMGLLPADSLILKRPFRAPHHSITAQALVGGMGNPKPGEITLAHKGILFLDEAAEFRKSVLENLRQPMEDKQIVISRMQTSCVFPADFMLVMATNPCKCGFFPDRQHCRCTQAEVDRYFGKIRGPILDRIDICVGTARLHAAELSGSGAEKPNKAGQVFGRKEGSYAADSITGRREGPKAGRLPAGRMEGRDAKELPFNPGPGLFDSEGMRSRIMAAQKIQKERFSGSSIRYNSQMSGKDIRKFCPLSSACRKLLDQAYTKYNMTARGYYKILKVARTIADLEGAERISKAHLMEAIGYRNIYES